jgi:uncharacterized protein (PEP-CTERM system associated)
VYATAEQPFALPGGTNPQVLNDVLRSQLADPAQREQLVNQFLQRLGLPPGTVLPFSFFTNQVYVAKQVSASVGLVGKRNTAIVELFWQDDEPITTPTGIPSGFFTASRVRQQGLRLTYSHRLSPFTALSLVGTRVYSREDTLIATALRLRSTEDTVYISMNRKLSPRTDASVALRWSNFDSNLSPYRERALIGVIAHHF